MENDTIVPKSRGETRAGGAGSHHIRLTIARSLGGGKQTFLEATNARWELLACTLDGVWSDAIDVAESKAELFIAADPSAPQVKVGKASLGDLQSDIAISAVFAERVQLGIDATHVNVEKGGRRDAVCAKATSHAGSKESRKQLIGGNSPAHRHNAAGAINHRGARKNCLKVKFAKKTGRAANLANGVGRNRGVGIIGSRAGGSSQREMFKAPPESNGGVVGRFKDRSDCEDGNAKGALKAANGAHLGLMGGVGLGRPGVQNIDEPHAFQAEESMLMRDMMHLTIQNAADRAKFTNEAREIRETGEPKAAA